MRLSKTSNCQVVRIPFVVSPIAIQLELATIPIQFKDVLVAVAVRFVWRAIKTPLPLQIFRKKAKAVFYS